MDYRWASGDVGRIRAFAMELVELSPDIIVGYATPSVVALQQETHSIPIVFLSVTDPVGQGLVASLAHPGGNITGFAVFEFSLGIDVRDRSNCDRPFIGLMSPPTNSGRVPRPTRLTKGMTPLAHPQETPEITSPARQRPSLGLSGHLCGARASRALVSSRRPRAGCRGLRWSASVYRAVPRPTAVRPALRARHDQQCGSHVSLSV